MEKIHTCACSRKTSDNSVEYAFVPSLFLSGRVIREYSNEHASASSAAKRKTYVKSVLLTCSLVYLWTSEIRDAVKMEWI
jgi:hypothetical protein